MQTGGGASVGAQQLPSGADRHQEAECLSVGGTGASVCLDLEETEKLKDPEEETETLSSFTMNRLSVLVSENQTFTAGLQTRTGPGWSLISVQQRVLLMSSSSAGEARLHQTGPDAPH